MQMKKSGQWETVLGEWCGICISAEIIRRLFTVIGNVTLIRVILASLVNPLICVCSRKGTKRIAWHDFCPWAQLWSVGMVLNCFSLLDHSWGEGLPSFSHPSFETFKVYCTVKPIGRRTARRFCSHPMKTLRQLGRHRPPPQFSNWVSPWQTVNNSRWINGQMLLTESLQPEISIRPHLLLLLPVPPSTLLQRSPSPSLSAFIIRLSPDVPYAALTETRQALSSPTLGRIQTYPL